jgi:hypothetical protein
LVVIVLGGHAEQMTWSRVRVRDGARARARARAEGEDRG